MTTYLSDQSGRNNNFNLIRFIAAFAVLISHSYVLVTGSGEEEPLKQSLGMSLGSIAVDVFFVTSGYLVANSLFKRNKLKSFALARLLRIYPALFVVIILTTFLVGPIFTALPVTQYFSDPQTYRYLIKNIILFFGVEYQLPGMFNSVPFANAVNGSLWTLPYEVKMYCLLALLGLCIKKFSATRQLNIPRFFLITTSLSIAANVYVDYAILEIPQRKFLHLFSIFFTGSTLYLYRNLIPIKQSLALTMVFLVCLALAIKPLFFTAYIIALPYLTLYIAYGFKGRLLAFNRIGDYSYGIYIYAFPIQQIIIMLQPETPVSAMIIKATILCLACATLSWIFIEKPSLQIKSQLMTANKKAKSFT